MTSSGTEEREVSEFDKKMNENAKQNGGHIREDYQMMMLGEKVMENIRNINRVFSEYMRRYR